MNKLRRLILLVSLLLLCGSPGVMAQGKLTAYTTWDDNYFYAAFIVTDPDVTGTNTRPHSHPWEDDCMEVFLETDGSYSPGRSKATFHMGVSAAGGSAFTVGSQEGVWQQKEIFTFKYAVIVDGSVNNPEDQDTGYVVEIALPWVELGLSAPTPGKMMGFNVIVRMKGDTNGFTSLSPDVKTEADIHDASKWSNIVFTRPAFGVATLTLDKIISARYVTRMPLIDGQIRSKEWNKNTSFELPLPIEALKRPKHQFQSMLLTYYFYWYQGDPRKAAPFAHVRKEDGSSELTDQPIRGAGPWFSYDRVQWHKEELADIKRAGIDIILPVYWGDPGNRKGFAAKGLDCLVEAIRELKEEKQPYPLIGMFFDTTSMQLAYGGKPDLRDDEVKRTFYGMIRDFFLRIPEEYRAQVQMGDERAGRPCCIVHLYTSSWFSDFDESFIGYVNERFAQDFDRNIFWMGAKDYKEKASVLDAYCDYGAGRGFGYDDTAKLRIAAVGPGYDDTAVDGRTTPIRPRNDGAIYQEDWTKALAKRPQWIMLDGWNELHEGSEICASRQYGINYISTTSLQSLKFRGAREYDAKYLQHNLPCTISPGKFYEVDITIQNDGTRPWRAAEGYALAYRWYQEGAPVGESGIKLPIQKDILPGHSDRIKIGIAAVREDAGDLPDGDYEIRFEMVRLSDDKWFSSLGDEGFAVPIGIGKPPLRQATCLSIDGPVMLKTGTTYPFNVRIRNDGSETWGADWKIGCRLFRTASYLHGGPDDLDESVPTTPMDLPLGKEIQPGQVVDALIEVNLKDPSGQPVPVWSQSEDWSYQLRFDIWDGERWTSETGARSGCRIVDVFSSDYGAKIIGCDAPDTLDAGKTYDVKLLVKNTGPEAWTPDHNGFGYHWYYLDGIEAVWDGERTPIKNNIAPGEPAVVRAKLTVPPYDGRYILAWDFYDGDRWASTSEITRGGDLLTTEVTVRNGRLVFADLSKLYDTVASSPDLRRDTGDFDGRGASFPAEMIPPDVGIGKPGSIYPCGYNWKVSGTGLECSRRISFIYGPKGVGDKNAVRCSRQVISVPKDKYTKIHVLAAAIQPNQKAEFDLDYDGTVELTKLMFSSWDAEPANGEEIAFVALHRHSNNRDERGQKCFLFHYEIPVDQNRSLTSVVLPRNNRVRIMALTLERVK